MTKYKSTITIAIIIVVVVVLAYFKNESNKTYLQNSIQCRDIGIKAYKEDNIIRDSNYLFTVYDPKFYFVKKTNTCLSWGGYSFLNPDSKLLITYIIKDVYRNNEIAILNIGETAFHDEEMAQKYNKLFKQYFESE